MLQRCPDDQEIALREGCGGLANRQQNKLGLVVVQVEVPNGSQ